MKTNSIILTLLILPLLCIGQNNSMNFDGSDDYIELGNEFGFISTDSFSIEAWVKSTGSGYQQIVSKLSDEFRGWGIQIHQDGVLSGYLFSEWTINQYFTKGTTFIVDGQWHHVAMTYNGSDSLILYLDGEVEPLEIDELRDAPLGPIVNTANTHIGNFHGNEAQDEFLQGNIDEVRIWNDVRTGVEINTSYSSEFSGTEENLIAYYKMDNVNSECDIADCNENATHGERFGLFGANNLPQFDGDVPTLDDVDCGAQNSCFLGIDDTLTLGNVVISPNPANNYIVISGISQGEITTISLINTLGEVIKESTSSNSNFDISEIPSGLYFVKISVQGSSILKKLIKK